MLARFLKQKYFSLSVLPFFCLMVIFVYLGFTHFASGGIKQELDQINTDIEVKKDQITEINSRIKQYEKSIAQKQ